MWFLRCALNGCINTDFIGVESCEKVSAENVVKGLKTIIEGNVKMEWTEFCSKLIAVFCDGASVMTGVKAGIGALLRKTQPSIITIHCLAHRIELSLKDSID